MPIHQDKLINILKAGEYYRRAYQGLYDKVKKDLHDARRGYITHSLPEYILQIDEIMEETTNRLNPTYGQYIEAGLLFYTPAKLKENERSREWHQKKRDSEQPNRKRRARQSIMDNDLPTPNIPVSNTMSELNTCDMNKVLIQIRATPIPDDDDVWPPPNESLKED